jgi:hypothetical protein
MRCPGSGDISSLHRNLLRDTRKILTRHCLLLTYCFEPISNFGQFLRAISHNLGMVCDLVQRCDPALLQLLSFGSCSKQLLRSALDLLSDLRLLLAPGLELLLDRGKLPLCLIAGLCGFAHLHRGCNDFGLQVGK